MHSWRRAQGLRRKRRVSFAAWGAFVAIGAAGAASMGLQPDAVRPGPPISVQAASPSSPQARSLPEATGLLERYVIVSEESQALYRAQEVFLGLRPPNRAVGLTRAIRGEVLIDRRHFPNSRPGPIRVDLRQLTSDDPRRDQAIRDRWLESSRFPIATFRVATVEGLPETYQEGQRVAVVLRGDLTVRDVTRRVSFQGSFVLEDGVLRGTASTTLRMRDFAFNPPSILGVLRVDDEAEVQVDLMALRMQQGPRKETLAYPSPPDQA